MTKTDAIKELMSEARRERVSTAAAKRVVRACRTLGLDADETRAVLVWLEYCDRTGEPFSERVERVWQ
jgi:hypothetical protein